MINAKTTKSGNKKFAEVTVKGTGYEILNEVRAIIVGILEKDTLPREKFIDMLLDTLMDEIISSLKEKHKGCDGDCDNCDLHSEDDDQDDDQEDDQDEVEPCCENCKFEKVPANKLPCRNCVHRVSVDDCFEEKN